jgi:hypothetical protein
VPHLFGILFVLDPLNLQRCPAFVNFIFLLSVKGYLLMVHGLFAVTISFPFLAMHFSVLKSGSIIHVS